MSEREYIKESYARFRALHQEAWAADRDTAAFTYQEEIDAMERKYPWLKKLRSEGKA